MSYTPHDYLNKIIQVAIDDGSITEDEIIRLIDIYGSDDEQITIDILSMVHQRREDKKKLQELQSIYRDYQKGLQPK